jgi:hypothetical protein
MFGDAKDNKKIMGDHGDDEMTPKDVEFNFFSSNNDGMLSVKNSCTPSPLRYALTKKTS